jgi:hypothetical protein
VLFFAIRVVGVLSYGGRSIPAHESGAQIFLGVFVAHTGRGLYIVGAFMNLSGHAPLDKAEKETGVGMLGIHLDYSIEILYRQIVFLPLSEGDTAVDAKQRL